MANISPDTTLPGQESAWDYPRPPRLERVSERLRVVFAGQTIADTKAGYRVLETSHPPVYYIPWSDIQTSLLDQGPGNSFCEYKGEAVYWSILANGKLSKNAGWSYPNPTPNFEPITGYVAFYASRVDECWIDDEKVIAQEGDFYGGWISSRVAGPFKGPPRTWGW